MTGSSPPTPGAAAAWLSRIIGSALLLEQSGAHLIGLPTDLKLLGAGLMLLTGKEGVQLVQLLLGRGPAPPSSPPES